MASFDVVSEVNLQEVENAVNQAQREIQNRYDFKGSTCEVTLDKKAPSITLLAEDEMKLSAVSDILLNKMVKRSVPTKSLVYGKTEPTGRVLKKEVSIQQGLSKEQASQVMSHLKKTNKKLQSQLMGEQVRVTSKSKNELQDAIQNLKSANLDFDIQFTNYR